MAQSCPDVSAKMMELLYGELPEEVRVAVEAHIAGCARCTAEREGFEQTRAVARAVLDEPPPARARVAILQAAAAHAAGVHARLPQAAAAAAPAMRAADKGQTKAPTADRRSFWDWIRSRWALPTLATVGAVAVFVIGSRLFLDPERTYERGKQAVAPETASAPEAVAPPPVAPSGGAPVAGGAASSAAPELDERSLRPVSVASRHRNLGKEADKEAEKKSDGARTRSTSERAIAKDEPTRDIDALLKGTVASSRAAPAEKAKSPSKKWADDPLDGTVVAEKRQFAPPPPPPKAEAEKESAAPAPTSVARPRPVKREMEPAAEADLFRDSEGGAAPREEAARKLRRAEAVSEAKPAPKAAAAPAAPAAPAPTPGATTAEQPASPKRKKQVAADTGIAGGVTGSVGGSGLGSLGGSAMGSSGGVTAPAAGGKQDRQDKQDRQVAKGPADDMAALALRADRLFAEGRWSEAAATYRDLLRRDPRNTAAGRWRQRLAVVQTQMEAAAAADAPPRSDKAVKAAPANAH